MKRYLNKLANNLLYIAGTDELTNAEMAKRCGISKSKLEEIIYRRNKGLRLETLVKISDNLAISLPDLIMKELSLED
ncbi:MAG: helix-turn-helix domain-containing protein [Lachnospiraceae bacterium]|nr:helix-turn-helix domain-containing protein [Lachnospiraceae bacterium]